MTAAPCSGCGKHLLPLGSLCFWCRRDGPGRAEPELDATPFSGPEDGRFLSVPEEASVAVMDEGDLRLYDYQETAVEALRANIRSGVKNQVLCAPTGSGKTVVATYLIREAHSKGKRAIFLADRIALIDQTSAVLDKYGIPHGVIQANHWRWRPHELVQIASPQTLERRTWPDPLDLIIVDECHTTRRVTKRKIRERESITIGLTATPFSRGMGRDYDAVVSVTTTQRLIDDRRLAPFRVFAPSEPDMTGAKTTAGEWTDREAETRSIPIVGDCVREYLRHADGRKFLVFGATIAHCEELQRQFLASGVQVALYTSHTQDADRSEILTEFRKPDSYIRGLASVAALSKGFDVEDVSCIIMARPLRSSLAEHIQILGRGLRHDPGDPAKECLVLDHAGNCIEGSQRVLTHRGLVPIAEILLTDRLWDGVEFVSHDGVVCNGRKRVITYAGLTATPDHLVKTPQGWRTLGECAEEQAAIVTTGVGGAALRECDDHLSRSGVAGSAQQSQDARSLRMRHVRESLGGVIQQPDRRSDPGVQAMQPTQLDHKEGGGGAAVAPSKGQGDAQKVHHAARRRVQGLRWSRNRVSVREPAGVRSVDREESGLAGRLQGHGTGPNQQRRPLRTGEHPLGNQGDERQQHEGHEMGPAHASIQAGLSPRPVRGQFPEIVSCSRHDVRGNRAPVAHAVEEAEGEVWDILNAGPRNRFTCEGLLVHNCVRFWDAMSEFFEDGPTGLDDGKPKDRKKPEEKPEEERGRKCPTCHHVHGPRPTCPNCGHEYPRKVVQHQEGELAEVGKPVKASIEEKQSWYAQLIGIARDRGYKDGWASHKYKERFGVWPASALDKTTEPASMEVKRWVRSRQIAWAKRRKA